MQSERKLEKVQDFNFLKKDGTFPTLPLNGNLTFHAVTELVYNFGIFWCISWDFKTWKLAQKIDLDLYTGNISKVLKYVWI